MSNLNLTQGTNTISSVNQNIFTKNKKTNTLKYTPNKTTTITPIGTNTISMENRRYYQYIQKNNN